MIELNYAPQPRGPRPLIRAFGLILFLAWVGSGMAQEPPMGLNPDKLSGLPTNGSNSLTDDRYRIGPGDIVGVNVLDYPQLSSESVRVDSRGMISMPMIVGEIQAACRTEGELAKEIAQRYLKYLKEPEVKVYVKEYQSQPVAIIGAVNAPGRFQLQRRVRLLELLTFANGPAERAGRSIQIIHAGSSPVCESSAKDANESVEAGFVTLKLSETLQAKEQANPFVQAGDIINLPDAEEYYLIGNVAKPAAYAIKEPISLTRAIAMAGGTLAGTKTDKVRIIRQSAPGMPKTELVVDLKLIAKQQTGEIMLEPNDIVDVPKAGGATVALKNIFKSFIPMATQLPLRVMP